MNIDIRVKLDLFEHPKIGKLRRRLGAEGVLALLRLWLWAAANRCDGILRGLDAESVELAAQWNGGPGEFTTALCELRLLDRLPEALLPASPDASGAGEIPAEGALPNDAPAALPAHAGGELFRIHDWREHQSWACRSDERTRVARQAAQSRWGKAAKKEDSGQEKDKETRDLCSSMLDASPSNAPKARNRKPKTRDIPEAAEAPAGTPAPSIPQAPTAGSAEASSLSPASTPAFAASPAPAALIPASSPKAVPASILSPAPVTSAPERTHVLTPLTTPNRREGGQAVAPLEAERLPQVPAAPAAARIPGTSPASILSPAPVTSAQAGQGGAEVRKTQKGREGGQAVAPLEAERLPQVPAAPAAARIPGTSPASILSPAPVTSAQAGQGGNQRQTTRGETRVCSPGAAPGAAMVSALAASPAPASSLLPAHPVPAPPVPAAESGRRAFQPPSFEEVQMYCALRGGGVDARRFVEWCEARQWRVGGERIRDWRALVRRWERREREGVPAPRPLPAETARLPGPRAAGGESASAFSGPSAGLAGLPATSVHQALVRERDLIARMILKENRGIYARPAGNAQASGAPQPSLPPEWADGR